MLGQVFGFRGLTALSHHVDVLAWGRWFPGYRLTNIALSALAAALAAVVAARVSGSRRVGLTTGLMFAVHPVHVEVVASIVNRKDLLAAILLFLALLAWRSELKPVWRCAATCALYVLALLAKEVAAAGFVGVVIVHDLLFATRPAGIGARGLSRSLLPALILLFVAVSGTLALLRWSPVGIEEVLHEISFWTNGHVDTRAESVSTALASTPRAATLLVFPKTLSVMYPIAVVGGAFDPLAQIGLAILLALVYFAARSAKRRPVLAFGLMWTLLTYVPVSNIVLPVSHHFVQDRYLYVPSFGLCLVIADLAMGKESRARGTPLLMGAVGLALLLAGARTVVRTLDWRSDRHLVESARRVGITTPRFIWCEAELQAQRGDLAGAAETHERALVARGPMAERDFFGHLRLAELYFALGRAEPSIEHLRRVLAIRDELTVRLSLVRALILAGELDEAELICREAQAEAPGRSSVIAIVNELEAARAAHAAYTDSSTPR